MQKKFNFHGKSLLCIFLLFFIAASSTQIMAEEPKAIGKVVALRGVVLAVSSINQEKRRLNIKDQIFISETIQTKQGRVQLMFKDNTLISLGRNTQMLIQDYLWEPGNKASKVETFVKEGSFRVMGGAITRDAPQNFKTHTPAATIGIRGSMYAGVYRKGVLSVVFEGGRGIFIANNAGSVDIDIPGFGTRAKSPEQPPEKPEKFDLEDMEKIESSLASDTTSEDGSGDSDESDELADSSDTEDQSEETSTQHGSEASSTMSEVLTESTTDTTLDEINNSSDEGIILSMLNELGYTSSAHTNTVPTTGVTYFTGNLKDLNDHDDQAYDDELTVAVNWNSGRFFAYSSGSNGEFTSEGFGYGDVMTDGTMENMVAMGATAGGNNEPIETLDTTETFAQFYGASPDALGIVMEGYDVNVQNQTEKRAIKEYIAAIKNTTETHPTGTENLSGFFIGVTEDMANPNANRRIYTNTGDTSSTTAADKLLINLDKNNGRVIGALSGYDYINTTDYRLNNIVIGSATDNASSVCITNQLFAAKLGGTDVVQSISDTGSLKDHGNYLIVSTQAPLDPAGDTVWGYWEMAYEEPGPTNRDYHTHVPGSLWIAGIRNTTTPPGSGTGSYSGKAIGVKVINSGPMEELTEGTINLNINFGGGAGAITGNIDFSSTWGKNFTISGNRANVVNSGFYANLSGGAGVNDHINGAFYGASTGTGPKSIAGNFSVDDNANSTQYHGIFAGSQ